MGIVGYGHLGRFLAEALLQRGGALGLELAFVWNRTRAAVDNVPADLVLDDLNEAASR